MSWGSKLENECKDLKPTRAIMYINTESEPGVQDKGHGDIMYSMEEMARPLYLPHVPSFPNAKVLETAIISLLP